MSKSLVFLSAVLCSVLFFSCKTFGGVQKETVPFDYSDVHVIENEKKRIENLLQEEPVEGYWRSVLLGDKETKVKCVSLLTELTKTALEEKDYVTAWRFINSLEITGERYEEMSFSEIDTLLKNDVPGFGVNDREPEDIGSVVKATVTVWVDKGIKIENGAGYPDKILGSGFFIDKRGYIVTNHHVISDMVDTEYKGYSRLYISLPGSDSDRIPARIIGYDSSVDLALLKAEYDPEYVLSLGSSSSLQVGDKISVIGAPLGLEGTLTSGIVSNTKRKLFTTGDVFQIDAPVNSGNSGGPCVDENMKVQAVVFAGVLQAQGLNFAIPVEYLIQELPVLYAGGEYQQGWTGCYGHTKKNGSKRTGVEVQYVMPGSSARLAGVKAGDIIVKVNGKEVLSLEKLQGLYRDFTPGTILSYEFEDRKDPVLIYLSKRGHSPSLEIYESDLIENSFVPLFGMQLVPASTVSKKAFKVDKVIEKTNAEEMQFSENDQIEIKNIKIDKENKYIITQILTVRHKKSLFDVYMGMGAPFDGPNYF